MSIVCAIGLLGKLKSANAEACKKKAPEKFDLEKTVEEPVVCE